MPSFNEWCLRRMFTSGPAETQHNYFSQPNTRFPASNADSPSRQYVNIHGDISEDKVISCLNNNRTYSMSKFYCDIYALYSLNVKNRFVTLAKTCINISDAHHDLKFLLKCRSFDVFPRHIENSVIPFLSITFHSNFGKKMQFSYSHSIKKTLLGFEISDLNIHINFLHKKRDLIINDLQNLTSSQLCHAFLSFFQNSISFQGNSKKLSLERKFIDLLSTCNPPLADIYSGTSKSYNNITSTPEINKWVVNLSKVDLTAPVKEILCLGDKHSYTSQIDQRTAFSLYKNIEQFLHINELDNSYYVRDSLVKCINKAVKTKKHKPINLRIFENKLFETKKFLKNNPHLLVTKADKGNATIVIERDCYVEKVKNELNNDKYYEKLPRDPSNALKNIMSKLIKSWTEKGVFDCLNSPYIIESNLAHTTISRAYGLIKIHKEHHPARVVVSTIGSPTYVFDKFISKLFTQFLPRPKYSLKNSLQLKNCLNNLHIPEGHILISLDVVSLFTNVHSDLVISAIKKKWVYLRNCLPLTLEEFLEGIKTLLNSTFFKFDEEFFHQLIGSPMGGNSSPWFAELVLEQLEVACLEELRESILFYRRYVDDCFLIVKESDTELILNTFNNYNNFLKFTIEKETDNSINFLDMRIIRCDNKILTDWYQKPTATGRYINFNSHHPLTMKKALVYNLTDKAILLSHFQFHDKNLELIKNFLSYNNYPLPFINFHIKKRINKIFSDTQCNNQTSTPTPSRFIVLPYIEGLTVSLKNILKRFDISVIHSVPNKFNDLIKLGKDKLDPLEKRNIVYKINCNDCSASYVGQSGRSARRRMYEHSLSIKNCDQRSVLSEHVRDTGHSFDIQNPLILDSEPSKFKREFSEMLHIFSTKNTLNRKTDLFKLQSSYKKSCTIINSHSR